MIDLQPEKAGMESIKSGECDHEGTRRCPFVSAQVLGFPVSTRNGESCTKSIMKTNNRDQRFAGRTENPFKSPSFSWTIVAIFVLTILNAVDFADGLPRNKAPDEYITGLDPTFWGDLAAKGHEKGWDVVESVRKKFVQLACVKHITSVHPEPSEKGTLDGYAKSLVLILGRIVAIQSLTSLMSTNEDEISNEVRWIRGKRYGRL
jgi:hypothetical protein